MVLIKVQEETPVKMAVREATLVKGEDGKSAYQIAQDNGFVGTQEAWLLSLHGKDGKDGKDGYTPVKGVDYFDGKDGQDGYTPQKGVDYFDGKDGQDGQDGKDGKDGQNGQDGKNGVSCTHKWEGTTLTVTSASGTSSVNLKGDKGDKGDSPIVTVEKWTFELTDGTIITKDVAIG
jgi:hypothetical protein